MGQLLVAVLPLALGAAVSPTLLALQLLVLSGPTHRLARAWSLALGAALVLGAFSLLCLTALQHIQPHHARKSATDAGIFIASGVLLGGLVVRSRVHRQTPGENHSSKTAERLTTAATPWFVGAGALGMVVNFSTLLLFLPAIHEITRSNASPPDKVAAFAILYVVVLLPVLVPVVFASVLGRRADGPLDATHQWVGRNSRTIGTVIEATFAIYLLTKGVRTLP
jgi:hypothetical protein